MSTSPKKIIRRMKIKRGDRCYRPDLDASQVPEMTARTIEVHFIIPIATDVGTDEELSAVKELRDALRRKPEVVTKAGMRQDSNMFTVVCEVRAATASDDELLTHVFLQLRPVIDSSKILQEGFCETKPRWQAIKGGDFVADEGGFV